MAHEELDFATLRQADIERQKEWDPDNKLDLTYRGNELAGETGEACNAMKKIQRERLGIRGTRDTIEHLAEELADVVICADLIAMHEGIDLGESVRAKFNATSEKFGLKTRINSVVAEKESLDRAIEELEDVATKINDDAGIWSAMASVDVIRARIAELKAQKGVEG